ncbi:hypothetical protein M0R88_09080 [Halorussus gelatinilyticus]|uniref:Uncharacterized protein n=1 Tax=Halorussus gelatinilyticus TaxID=2937524 RepID=A0A8U0INR2_9EURY|nr:hypothetical protein [Halorussus gelatinilyticus]UPW02231.1 hypothetical protein M0R88_09080 [Halorussus gelatinilyticus]
MRGDATGTRRGFLAAAGVALFAGCSEFGPLGDDSSDSVLSHELPDVTDDGESEPVVAEAIPVTIERSKLDEATRRVTALLETLPMPFGPESVPNGHIRRRLLDAASDATARVEDARTAQTRFSALRSLREARTSARYASAGWGFVERDLTQGDLAAEHRRALDEARELRANHEYLGADPVRAALVHAHVERNLDRVLDARTPSGRVEDGSLLAVAEWGEHAEQATAFVADSRYLYGQFTASLPSDAGTVEERLATAAERLARDLRSRRKDLPPEPTENDRDIAWWLRYRLRDAAASSADPVADATGPAGAVLAATRGLTDFLAYDRVRDRTEGGERFGVRSAAEVRTVRSQAVEAIRTALEGSPRPELVRPVLADAASRVAFADEALARYRGEVRLARLDDPLRRYYAATARARSAPSACRRVLDALEI